MNNVRNNQHSKHLSIRLSKIQYDSLKEKAHKSHMKFSEYVREQLLPSKTKVFDTKDKNKILRSNARLNLKLDELKGYPWRACENLNRLTKLANQGQQIFYRPMLNKVYKEVKSVKEMLENLKRKE